VEKNNVHCLIGPLAAFEALAIDDYIRRSGCRRSRNPSGRGIPLLAERSHKTKRQMTLLYRFGYFNLGKTMEEPVRGWNIPSSMRLNQLCTYLGPN
jgi:hypothetical protein